ncbi:MAG TPA: zf-HC2 domain-containing protein [Fimbriimonadaceae bacterium]|nr:zf-HC2 domain-containing protein [Fimbriimonadaceae bacterium]
MQLQNFECQIAKAQIGRFVAGDQLSEEALSQLEAHIAKCPDCQRSLAERREALQGMLAPKKSGPPSEGKKQIGIADFIKSRLKSGKPVQAAVTASPPKPSSFTKPAIYSLALAAVLIGMSYMSRNIDSVMGPKAAATSVPPAEPPKAVAQPARASHPIVPKPKTVTPPITPKPKANTKPAAKPKPAIPENPPHPTPSRPRHGGKHKRHDANTIRVYEPEN